MLDLIEGRPWTAMWRSGTDRGDTHDMRCVLSLGGEKIPLAPHLLFPQFMDDADVDERELAMFFNRILLSHCEAMWVYTPRVSAGMRIEIEWAHINDLPIRYLDEHFGQVAL